MGLVDKFKDFMGMESEDDYDESYDDSYDEYVEMV